MNLTGLISNRTINGIIIFIRLWPSKCAEHFSYKRNQLKMLWEGILLFARKSSGLFFCVYLRKLKNNIVKKFDIFAQHVYFIEMKCIGKKRKDPIKRREFRAFTCA